MWVIPAILSAFIQGSANVMQKKLVTNMSSSVFSFLFNFFCLIFFIPILPLVQWSVFALLIIFAKSFLTVLAFYLRTKALKFSSASEIFPLVSSLNPLFVFLFAFLFIQEKISTLKFFGLVVVIFGSMALISNFRVIEIRSKIGLQHGLVLASSIFYAINAVVTKFLLNSGTNIFTILFFSTLFTTLGLFIMVNRKSRRIVPDLETKLTPFALTGLLTSVYRLLAVLAMDLGPVSLVSATRRLQSPISVFLGGKVLKEKEWELKLLASIIMLAGIYLMVL